VTSDVIASIVKNDWIEFCAHQVVDAKLLWFNSREQAGEEGLKNSIDITRHEFLRENAYAISANKSFNKVIFNINNSKMLVAERYGGSGIGSNGGGARCGNTEKYQLKGVGANCFASEKSDFLHSYGGLDAPSAIIETINSYIFGKILPLGTVKIHGLIWIGEEAGFDVTKNANCKGFIMVRDKSLRPAHLMRTIGFVPRNEYESIVINDVARLRKINKLLAKSLGGHTQFIALLGRFLKNHANQFGFARAARLMNGVISPSNCTMDGRWIDLNSCSLVGGGINYSIQTQFFTEHELPLTYAIELLYSYSKYNGINLDATPLINYYKDQFLAHFQHHIGFVIGYSRDLNFQFSDSWTQVTKAFYQVIHANNTIMVERAIFDKNDPVFALIRALYLSLYSRHADIEYCKAGLYDQTTQASLSNSFKEVIDAGYNQHILQVENFSLSYHQFIVVAFINSLKRSYYSAAFYLPLLENTVRKFCEKIQTANTEKFVNAYCDTADWIYEFSVSIVTLFKSEDLNIYLDTSTDTYHFKELHISHQFQSYKLLFEFLEAQAFEKLWIHDFYALEFFKALSEVLLEKERAYPIVEQYL